MLQIKDIVKYIFYIFIIVICFIAGKQCGSNGNTSKNDFKPIIDTLYIHKTDTIYNKDTIYTHDFKPNNNYIPQIDTSSHEYTFDNDTDRIYIYKDTIDTKEYNIVNIAHVQGKLRDLKTNVKLKVPLKIIDSTKVIIHEDSIIYRPSKYQVNIGMSASIHNIIPNVELSFNKNTYGIGYDPFGKAVYVTYKYRIWHSKK